jgi:hypothetical protein
MSTTVLQRQNRAFAINGAALPRGNNYVPDNQVYKLTQNYSVSAALTASASLPTFAAFSFNVNNLDQITSLSNVFDQYKIDEVETWLVPRLTDQVSASFNNGILCSVIDYDDANSLSTVAQAQDYTNCIMSSGLSGHYRAFKPHAAVAAYSGAFTSYGNVVSPWIDFASPSVQHFGIKYALSQTGGTQAFDLLVRLHISCRNVR